MKFAILIVLLVGAGWAYFQPASFNTFAAFGLIGLGAAVIVRGRNG